MSATASERAYPDCGSQGKGGGWESPGWRFRKGRAGDGGRFKAMLVLRLKLGANADSLFLAMGCT
jgi:hypothetical protein